MLILIQVLTLTLIWNLGIGGAERVLFAAQFEDAVLERQRTRVAPHWLRSTQVPLTSLLFSPKLLLHWSCEFNQLRKCVESEWIKKKCPSA